MSFSSFFFFLLSVFDLVKKKIYATFEDIEENGPGTELHGVADKICDQEVVADDIWISHRIYYENANAL